MKFKIAVITLFAVFILSPCTIAQTTLWVHHDGESTQFEIGEINKITFDLEESVPDLDKLRTVAKSFQLLANYPNPFNPLTNICYEINKPGFVEIRIYDLSGRELNTLVSEHKIPGSYEVQWDGETADGIKAAGGIYFYQLTLNGATAVKKMILIK